MMLWNLICYDTQPLFLSLSSIVPTGAVILFAVFATMSRKRLGSVKLVDFKKASVPL